MTNLRTMALGILLGGAAVAAPVTAQGPGGLIPTPDNPPSRQGTRGANFLHLGVGARANAMGGAIGSSIEGPTAWFWNPAGAAMADAFSLSVGRQNLFGDLGLRQSYAAIGMPLLGGVIGLGFNSVNSGDLERTSELRPLGESRAGESFTWTSTAVSAGYARRLTDRLMVGGQLKYITEGIPDAGTSWLSFDIGTQFRTGVYGLIIGGALQQVGGSARAGGALVQTSITTADFSRQNTGVDLRTRQSELPTEFRFSLGDDLLGSAESVLGSGGGVHHLYAEIAVNDAVDLPVQAGVGVEYGFRNRFFLRGGKRFFNDQRRAGASSIAYGLSGGAGVRLPLLGRNVSFDYSYTGLGDLQNTQVFSFELGR